MRFASSFSTPCPSAPCCRAVGVFSLFTGKTESDYNRKRKEASGVNGLPGQLARQRMRPRASDVRGDYFRDQTAIIHSTPFRRLKHKTQVFFAPENDHICTRIEHVLHVATIAATICRGLNHHGWQLDTELAYAAGLGHDLGHAPFGHSG